MKVLIADDDQDQLEVRSLLLSHSGFQTIRASDRESALRAAVAEKPDCAVVDLRLPTEEAGLRLIRSLKELDGAMRVIVLTGAETGKFTRLPERVLVDEVITKGSPASRLIETLRAWERRPAAFPEEE
jgi:two-component system C4-dicarboxylate transport response regulator DctD